MTTFQVYTSNGELSIEMEAKDQHASPTKISGPDRGLVSYAKELQSMVPGVSVSAIASRMGSRSYLTTKGGKDSVDDPNRDSPVEPPADAPVVKSGATAWRIRAEQSGEVVGIIAVQDNIVIGHQDGFDPIGYVEGMNFDTFRADNRGYVFDQIQTDETTDGPDVIDAAEQARLVGVATGAALMASGVISKSDEEQQVVYGWAYVTHDKDGLVNVDKSGDFVDTIMEIEKTALNFMLNSRAGDTDHNNTQSTTIVESMVFTPEKMEAMGIAKGTMPSGWWIGAKCDDPTWAGYKAGKWSSFSIHGSGTRSKAEPA